MSGITGIYQRNRTPVSADSLGRMTDLLTHRGPDAGATWHADGIGLGHRMLWTTQESQHETLPLAKRDGALVITADARIDNREELAAHLHLTPREASQMPDSAFILAAYEKWGEECASKLLGDFAFAIWDASRQSLFCARDHLGIRPFYYYAQNDLFAFGSEIKALLCLPQVSGQLDELQVGHYLAAALEDKTATLYQDILRLPPAHYLIVTPDQMQLREYWRLDPTRNIQLDGDAAYAEAFREIFEQAVHCRMRTPYPIGSLLSGGLDSSAVTCMASTFLPSGQKLHTISGIYDETPECDEQRYIRSVLERTDATPHYVPLDHVSPLDEVEKVLWHTDEPFASPTLYMLWSMCRTAGQQGTRVLLDGFDGDSAVSHGEGYLAELAHRGEWKAFLDEAQAIAQHENLASVPFLLETYGTPYLTELARQWRWGQFLHESSALSRYINASRLHLWREYGIKALLSGRNGSPSLPDAAINPEFAQRIGLRRSLENLHQKNGAPVSARSDHFNMLTSGLVTYMFELIDKIGAAFGVEFRHPFADKRLIEFCLALPPDQQLCNGWNRFILRNALNDILPLAVRWRGGKALNSASYKHTLLKFEGDRLRQTILEPSPDLRQYMDTEHLQTLYHDYVRSDTHQGEMPIWQSVIFALWLQQRQNYAACHNSAIVSNGATNHAVAPSPAIPSIN